MCRASSDIEGRAEASLRQHRCMRSQMSSESQASAATLFGRVGKLLKTMILRITWASRLHSSYGCFPVVSSKMDIANEYTSASLLGAFPSMSSGAIHRTLPPSVNVNVAFISVTSSITFDIPKSQMKASPFPKMFGCWLLKAEKINYL